MKPLSESVTSILQAVTTAEVKPVMPAVGSIQQPAGDGMMIIPHQQPSLPATIDQIRTANSAIESMKRLGKLTVCSVNNHTKTAIRDTDGQIIRWESDLESTGNYQVLVKELDDSDKAVLLFAASPGHKTGIQSAIERLAQIKPIGRSDVKQTVVISTLVFDLVKMGASETAVNEVCAEERRSTASDFFPKYGRFLEAVERRMEFYKTAYAQATNQCLALEDKTEKDSIETSEIWGKSWSELTESQREQILNRGRK